MKSYYYTTLYRDFFKTLKDVNFDFNFKNLNYLPRWIILSIDVVVVLIAGAFTFFIFAKLQWHYIPDKYLLFGIVFQLITNILFFWLFRTYSGIIRHSGYTDALKLFFSQFATLATLIALNLLFILFHHQKVYLSTAAFINAVLSFSFLFFYRIIVKQTFEYFFKNSNTDNLIKVVVYGSNANAIAVATALNSELPQRYKLCGFIDINNQNTTKRILNQPIFQIKKTIPILLRSIGAEAIIFPDGMLSKEARFIIVEQCLEHNFKVFTVPPLTDWSNGKEVSKKIKNIEILDLLEREPIVLDTNTIANQLNNKTILVTGAAGSIGSEIVRQLLLFSPKTIILLDQAETPLHNLSLEIQEKQSLIDVKNTIADIKDYAVLERIFDFYKPHVVFHAAAYKHVPLMEENPDQAILTNILGTKNAVDLAQQYGVERFIMISTDKAVNPSSVMGASKRIAEMYVQSKYFEHKTSNQGAKTKFITTRCGNVLGSNGSVVPLFTKQIQEGGPITITHPDIIRYFMTIPEACQLVLEACAMGNGGEIYIFDMGKPVKIIDLAKKMIRLAGFKPDVDIKIKIIGMRPGEKLFEELLTESSKSLATHHHKIMIATDLCSDFDFINAKILDMQKAIAKAQKDEMVTIMKKIIPEFKSLNSVFQSLD